MAQINFCLCILLVVSKDEEQGACYICKKHDVKTKYGKKYRSQNTVIELAEEDFVSVDDGISSDLIASYNVLWFSLYYSARK